ncbi:MAG: ORF6N domain-containing protein [bacterium]
MADEIVPIERIQQTIYMVRGQKVMLDSDLAELYVIPTKALKQAVRRNTERFTPVLWATQRSQRGMAQ